MSETLLTRSVVVFLAIWSLGIVLLWTRGRIEILWKIIATLILAFYIWFFYDEVLMGLKNYKADWLASTLLFVKELISLIFVNLFFIWPFGLVLIFYKADPLGSERLLKFLCLLTFALWALFIVYFFFNRGIDSFILEELRKMIPHGS